MKFSAFIIENGQLTIPHFLKESYENHKDLEKDYLESGCEMDLITLHRTTKKEIEESKDFNSMKWEIDMPFEPLDSLLDILPDDIKEKVIQFKKKVLDLVEQGIEFNYQDLLNNFMEDLAATAKPTPTEETESEAKPAEKIKKPKAPKKVKEVKE